MPKAILKSAYFKSTRHVKNYMKYLDKQSPLFGLKGDLALEKAIEGVSDCEKSTFWRHVYSISEEDCKRLEIDRNYLNTMIVTERDRIAKIYNISPTKLQLACSFHEKDHHPHLHMVMYSTDNREGVIKVHANANQSEKLADASRSLKSIFTNSIFKEDLQEIKAAKYAQRQELNQTVENYIDRVTKSGYVMDKKIVSMLEEIGREVNALQGKKAYGFMPPAVKEKIDTTLRYIMMQEKTAKKLFAQYAKSQHDLVSSYVDSPETLAKKMLDWEKAFFSPSKKDDTTRHNMVLRAASKVDYWKNNKSELRKNNEYVDKSAGSIAQSMVRKLCKSVAKGQQNNENRQQAVQPHLRFKKLKKKTHRYDRSENAYEP